jgi:ketosteroid isomerase-like protein
MALALEGRNAVRAWNEEAMAAFPDLGDEKKRAFGQDDWVSLKVILRGTNEGPYRGPDGKTIPPTNGSCRVPASCLLRCEGGKIREGHAYCDRLRLSAQLGLL